MKLAFKSPFDMISGSLLEIPTYKSILEALLALNLELFVTISANGHVLPPMIIVPGIIYQEYWYTETDLPDDYLIGVLHTGSFKDYLTIAWLKTL